MARENYTIPAESLFRSSCYLYNVHSALDSTATEADDNMKIFKYFKKFIDRVLWKVFERKIEIKILFSSSHLERVTLVAIVIFIHDLKKKLIWELRSG